MSVGSGKRRDELAGQELLTAEDVAELTGLATVELQRIEVAGKPLVPCSPAELVAYSRDRPEWRLPPRFQRTVQMNEAGRRGDRWEATVIEALASAGLTDTQVDEAAFLEMTDFAADDDGLPDHSFYVLTPGADGGLNIGPDAESLVALDAWGRPEMEAAAAMRRNIPVTLPMSMAEVVGWVRRQGGDVQLTLPGSGGGYPESVEGWAMAVAHWLDQSGTVASGQRSALSADQKSHGDVARERWRKRAPVICWLKREREANPTGKVTPFLRERLDEIRARARDAGTPLAGADDSVLKTARGWLNNGMK